MHEVVGTVRRIELFLASVDELLDLVLCRMDADGLSCKVSESVPHNDGFLTSNLVVLVLNGHVVSCGRFGIHDEIELAHVSGHT